MKIYISAMMTIADLNRKFRRYFPYLKIELPQDSEYIKGYDQYCPADMRLVEASGIVKEGEITVHPDLTVSEICRQFYNRHMLSVKVFYKSRAGWSDASKTSYLLLEKQNEIGADACRLERNFATIHQY